MLFGFSILLKSVWNWDYVQRISGTIFVKEYMEEEFLLLSDITTRSLSFCISLQFITIAINYSDRYKL